MTKKQLSIEIDRKRALYHYYKKRPDLLSRCKSEVLKKELEDLKVKSYIESERCKIKRFLVLHPEYSNVFEKD